MILISYSLFCRDILRGNELGTDAGKSAILIFVPAFRLSVSYFELLFVIFWAFFAENGSRYAFLFSSDHGLSVFIATCILNVVYCQFPLLFPNFALPQNVNIRSKWGYAYSNELGEMKKIKLPKFP